MQIEVGVCTFRRDSLFDTLESLADQNLSPAMHLRVIVADNDVLPVRQNEIEAFGEQVGLALEYVHAPSRNISVARNACLDHATGEVLLFIDDDETADPDWVTRLIAAWQKRRPGVVFGPSVAVYPTSAPDWMRENDFHSNIPTHNHGVVETGFSSNALLDLSDNRVAGNRFDPAFGRTGGEDTDFFFRLHRAGVPLEVADDAIVRERVDPARLSWKWLVQRKRISGAIYGTCSPSGNPVRRAELFASGLAKTIYCGLRTLASAPDRTKCTFWLMRGIFHAGVVSGCVSPPRREVYGDVS